MELMVSEMHVFRARLKSGKEVYINSSSSSKEEMKEYIGESAWVSTVKFAADKNYMYEMRGRVKASEIEYFEHLEEENVRVV